MSPAQAGRFTCTLALLLALLPASVTAQQPASQAPIRAEIEYRVIKPQPLAVSSGIEVIDFFWYGCPHCYHLQPSLERWISQKPADVTVRRIPAILRDSWAPHARLYYTLEALGEVERLHQRVYYDYHVTKLSLGSADVAADWAANNGIARTRWEETYNSPAVQRKVEEASKLSRAYSITGTPSLVVNGRYLTSGNMTDTPNGTVRILDGLIAKMRAEAALR
jgi:thiol:disulfide interchange protein DsbA